MMMLKCRLHLSYGRAGGLISSPTFHRSNRYLLPLHRCYYETMINKKDVSGPMPDAYHPSQVEDGWYSYWESNKMFQPGPRITNGTTEKKNFSIALPPPNVTGSLHIGHALTVSLQDALSRYKKMDGYRVVWVPGMDHAGISTQVVVEKKLSREQNGKSRHDVGREQFIDLVWKWKEEFGNKITEQTKAMGAMTDWSRHVFTMDETFSKAVIETFVRLYEDDLIYRATRLVNWCPALNTVISDLEVDYISMTKKTSITIPSAGNKKFDFGLLHTFKYPVVDADGTPVGHIEISTTRLETMLGDTAVAVHPDDERYKQFHGKFIQHPFIKNRTIPIICDAELVQMEFGTGVVKVTPAHSFEDFACGKRNNLEFINIMNQNGTLNHNAGEFAGKNRFEVRRELVSRLKELDLFVSEKDHPMELPICSRSKDVIEPMMVPQWFVKCGSLAARSLELVNSGETKIYPSTYVATWERWLTNIHDWCISRQLWWGHRIPAYKVVVRDGGVEEEWVVARSLEEAHEKVAEKLGLTDRNSYELHQDEDVLDTWFSSGIYPLACFGWPNQTQDLQDFYPLSVMETGSDILFFWVARMAMLCTYLNNDIKPFTDIYLHPMVRDAQGRKMSKSLGNVIDPIDVMHGITLEELQNGVRSNTNIGPDEAARAIKVMEKDFPKGIQECGTDALRFSLIKYTQQGRQINLDVQRVVSNRFFCNKIWQATRFAKGHFENLNYNPSYNASTLVSNVFSNHSGEFHNKWILTKLNQAISKIRTGMDGYHFSDAATAVYDFFLYELCDVYLEWIKPTLYNEEDSPQRRETVDTLHLCLEQSFRLMHPFMPFISEELWQRLPRFEGMTSSILLSSYPTCYTEISDSVAEEIENQMDSVLAAVQELRSVKEHLQTAASKTDGFLCIHREQDAVSDDVMAIQQFYQSRVRDIEILSKLKSVQVVSADEIQQMKQVQKKKLAVGVVNKNCTVYLTLPDDYASKIEGELKKLQRKLEQLTQLKAKYEKQMSVPNYETNVPEAVREKTREKYEQTVSDIAICEKSISEMQALINE